MLHDFLDLFFPRTCVGCRVELGSDRPESRICARCFDSLPEFGILRCAFCFAANPDGKTCAVCRPSHHLDRLFVATDYKSSLAVTMVKECKYRFVKDLAKDMGRLICKRVQLGALSENAVIVPVPLHPKRFRYRGFNQAEAVASIISTAFSIPIAPDALQRSAATSPQADIQNRLVRMNNVVGVFKINKPSAVQNKNVFIVDDLSTTGSTLNDCARALKSAGAASCIGLVFARGG